MKACGWHPICSIEMKLSGWTLWHIYICRMRLSSVIDRWVFFPGLFLACIYLNEYVSHRLQVLSGPSGNHTVCGGLGATAFLRPHATEAQCWEFLSLAEFPDFLSAPCACLNICTFSFLLWLPPTMPPLPWWTHPSLPYPHSSIPYITCLGHGVL